jgi:hypothetical protein
LACRNDEFDKLFNGEIMTDDEKITTITHSLKNLAMGDVKRASAGESKIGAFMLCSCLIDAMAYFSTSSPSVGANYRSFVQEYLTSYNPAKLYSNLRCKLVHNYSEGGSYMFVHAQPSMHLKPVLLANRVYINLDNFIVDIESALESFCNKLQNPNETELRRKAVLRYNRSNIIQVLTMPSIIMSPSVSGTR